MGFLDKQIMPGNGGLLDPMLEQYMQQQRQQQFWGLLSQVGQSLMSANRQGQSPLRAISAGLARGRPTSNQGLGGLLDWMKVRESGQKQQAEKQYQNLVTGGSGYDPGTGINWNQARPGNPDVTKGMSPGQRGLLGALPRTQGLGLLADQMFQKPQQPPTGFARTPAGLEPITGGPADIEYLGRKAEATQKPTKATMGDRKLALLNKWRSAQEGRGQWSAADQAEWDMIIRADPMDILRRNMLRGMGGTPAGSTSGQGAPPPAPSAESPGWVERQWDSLFGSGADAGQGGPPGTAAFSPGAPNPLIPRRQSALPGVGNESPISGRPPLDALSPAQKLERLSEQRPGRSRGRLRGGGQKAKSPPLLPNGGIDRSGLVTGQVYLHPMNGQVYRWTGTEFVSAR